jgi:hypothetical protein
MIHKLIVFHSIRLMRQHLPFRRVVLGLLGKIDALPGHPGVEFVA